MGQSVRASEQGLAIANQARQRRGWTKTSTARWWQDAHTSRATLRRFWRRERIQQDAFIAICQTVGIDNWQELVEPVSDVPATMPQAGSVDWGDAPDVAQFYGRQQELQQLQTWILTESTKLVNISGLGGIGKTSLTLALAEQLQPEFSHIIWRSLNAAQSLDDLLTDLLDSPVTTVDHGVRQLLKKMQHRWLIVLDDVALAAPYIELIDQISRARHQSCLLIISRQPLPAQFQTLNRVQQLSLAGLSADAAAELLQACGCRGQAHQLKKLARLYSHNPLALTLAAGTIQTVFSGQIAPFLAQETVLLPDPIRLLFKQQFEQLAPLEKTLLFWLVIWQEPISLCRLQTHLLHPNPVGVMTALSTLMQHSLITQHFLANEPSFSLQPMVGAFVMDTLVAAIMEELIQGQQTIQNFQLLRTHCLLRPGTDDILGDRLLTALQENYPRELSQLTSASVGSWLRQAQEESPKLVGYLIFNLTVLRKILGES